MKLIDIIFENIVDLNETSGKRLTASNIETFLNGINTTLDFSNMTINKNESDDFIIKDYSCKLHPEWKQDNWVPYRYITYGLTKNEPKNKKMQYECDLCYKKRRSDKIKDDLNGYEKCSNYDFTNSNIISGKDYMTYVSNIYCTVKDNNGNDHGYFANDSPMMKGNLKIGVSGCPKCSWRGTQKYTKDDIIKLLFDNRDKVKTRSDFQSLFSGAAHAARYMGPCYDNNTKEIVPCRNYAIAKNGKKEMVNCVNCTNTYEIFNDVTKYLDTPEEGYEDKFIYVHEFYYPNGEKYGAYVGLTDNEEERLCSHTTGKFRNKYECKSVVTDILKNHPTFIHKYKKLTDFMSPGDSQEAENFWDLKYQEMGFKRLGKGRTGRGSSSLGYKFTLVSTLDKPIMEWKNSIFDMGKIPYLVILQNNNKNLYHNVLNRKDKDRIWLFRGIVSAKRKIPTYTNFELSKIAMSCENYDDFMKKYKEYSEEVNKRNGLKEEIEKLFEFGYNQYNKFITLFTMTREQEKMEMYSQENILRIGKNFKSYRQFHHKFKQSYYKFATPETRKELTQYFIDKKNIKESKLSLMGVLEQIL